ncbi:MAG: deoxyguanosinetriphosphate triphosphohydrolase [Dehalococcoidales bacterium]|jgi:dGTPase|nr:deoxyguanosinetriphosphate triphosphohydrolase [Dehalococcoidales bacterium]MDX9986041.1 deoxyguanosinetriphosphate triphosphohydrolase [Dehalococcoidales bacterium]
MPSWSQVRLRAEERELTLLSPYACKSRLSRGRDKPEELCDLRTEFQRDRDRIIHCKAFRRLKHKTQVFIAPTGDHYVTRLTHTLEVTQIARTIARALNLNEDLAEAIGLGHDLGHTPFGHTGEEVLNQLYKPGFRHNQQSLRVADILENDGNGLNLTWEVRDGILNHSKSMEEILGEGWGETGSLEADVVKLSDLVAYINHDVEDAIRAGMIVATDLPESSRKIMGNTHRERINNMITDIIMTSWSVTGQVDSPAPSIGMSPTMREAASELKDFLFTRVYKIRSMLDATEPARQIVANLFEHLCCHPELLPKDYPVICRGDTTRAVVDYIAGMTDQYASRLAEKLNL